MSILLYDPVEKRHVLLLREGPLAGRRWSVDLRACDNPCCSCLNIEFVCLPDPAPEAGAEPVRFSLDAEERSIYRPPGLALPAISDRLAEAVTAELGEAGWNYLYQFLLGVKQEQIDNCDPKRVDAPFPPEVLRGDGSVLGYSEIFPLSAALRFKIDSQEWLAVDDYCVNPDCECRTVILQFVTRERAREGSPLIPETAPAMYYDYKARTYEEAHAPTKDEPSLNALIAAVQQHWPGFEGEVRRRHRRMKALFRSARRRHQEALVEPESAAEPEPAENAVASAPLPRAEAPAMRKVGRNDPCPCGSGKKYKRCCGR